MDLGDSFRWGLDERGILHNVGKQPFALSVRHTRISPELLEVGCHRLEALPGSLVEDEPILVSPTLPLFSGLGQRAQLIVPFSL